MHLSAQRTGDRACVFAVDRDEQQEARVPLDERCDMGVRSAGEQVALPVAGDRAVLRLGRALADRDSVDDLALAGCRGLRRAGGGSSAFCAGA